jgi:pimeloyl-ACP methyl ester carboxylesterase
MKESQIFNSFQGKEKILSYYGSLINQQTIAYNEKYIDTNFGETFILTAGNENNPPVFLFHGSCSNSSMWFGDVPRLAKNYYVIAVDILGEAGRSEEKRLDLTTSEYADWIMCLMESLNIEKAVFIGNSYGGWLSLKFAVTYPDKVSLLILIAASGIVPASLSFVAKTIIYTLQGKKGVEKMNQMIFGEDKVPDEINKVTSMILENFNPMTGKLPVFSDEELSKLTMPVFFIAGENDVTMNVSKAALRLKGNISSLTCRIIKNHGHVIYNAVEYILQFMEKKNE